MQKKYMTLNLYRCCCNREACVDLLPILYTGCIESVFCIHPQITVSVNVTIMLKPTYQIPKKKGSVAPITYTKGCYSRFHPSPPPPILLCYNVTYDGYSNTTIDKQPSPPPLWKKHRKHSQAILYTVIKCWSINKGKGWF